MSLKKEAGGNCLYIYCVYSECIKYALEFFTYTYDTLTRQHCLRSNLWNFGFLDCFFNDTAFLFQKWEDRLSKEVGNRQ